MIGAVSPFVLADLIKEYLPVPTSLGIYPKPLLAAAIYGVAMGLTFDEFGMWIHLGGSYWQRASWDAITVVGGSFALIAFAPAIRRFRPHHWLTGIALGCVIIGFFIMLHRSFAYAGKVLEPKIHEVESTAPP